MRKLLACLCLLWAGLASAADNTVTLTPGAGVTMRTTDVGAGVQSSNVILSSTSGGGVAIYGTAGSSNANVLSVQGIGGGTALPVSLTSTTITGTVAATQSGTWNIGTVTTVTGVTTVSTVTAVTTLSTLTGGGVASGSADSGNPVKIGGKYNAAPIALTDGNRGDYQLSLSGAGRIMAGANWGTITTWTTATALNTNLVLMCGDGAQSVTADLQGSGTISAGQVSFQFSNDATDCSGTTGTWVNFSTANIVDQYTLAPAGANPWVAVTGQQKYTIYPNGTRAIRARLTTQLTGSGAQVIVSPTVVPANTAITGILNPLSAGSAIIGKVGVDQTTPGTTNGIAIVGVNAATALAGNGVTGTGSQRVTIASDNTPFPIKFDQTTPGSTNSVSFGTDPCSFLVKTNLAIDQAADTQIISGTSSKKTYICSISVIAAAAETVSVVAGTGTVCATGIAALIGSTTDANGLSFAANGGLTLGNGMATIASGATNADNICIRQGGTVRIAGNLTYVQN